MCEYEGITYIVQTDKIKRIQIKAASRIEGKMKDIYRDIQSDIIQWNQCSFHVSEKKTQHNNYKRLYHIRLEKLAGGDRTLQNKSTLILQYKIYDKLNLALLIEVTFKLKPALTCSYLTHKRSYTLSRCFNTSINII